MKTICNISTGIFALAFILFIVGLANQINPETLISYVFLMLACFFTGFISYTSKERSF